MPESRWIQILLFSPVTLSLRKSPCRGILESADILECFLPGRINRIKNDITLKRWNLYNEWAYQRIILVAPKLITTEWRISNLHQKIQVCLRKLHGKFILSYFWLLTVLSFPSAAYGHMEVSLHLDCLTPKYPRSKCSISSDYFLEIKRDKYQRLGLNNRYSIETATANNE